MARSDELIRERSEYYAFKEQISNLILKISNAVEAYTSPKKRIQEMYQVNLEYGDYGKLQNDHDSITTLMKNLTNNTLPAIQNKIDQLSADIQAAIQSEEEERRQQEEAAQNAAQQAARATSSN